MARAKAQATEQTAKVNLIDSFAEFKDAEGIDRPTLIKVMTDTFKTALRKKYGTEENVEVIVNDQNGDLELYHKRAVVEDAEFEDELTQIPLSEAQAIDEDLEAGEDYYETISIDSLGRRVVLAIKQTLTSRISELKKNILLKNYQERVGEVVTGEVYQIWKKEIMLLDDEGNELILRKEEQIPTDYFKKSESVKAIVQSVEMKNGTPIVYLSRTNPSFLAKLLEAEVPEIMDGLITIKKIVREPGERAKVAVESYDDRIDPVGACVGMKGSRIHGIVRELRNENIDIINYTQNIQLLLQRSLTPAKITSMKINPETKYVEIMLKPDQVSLAIGRKGVNIKLAQELTGYEIDVFRDDVTEEEYDIDIEEFNDAIDQWVIDALKRIGCDTGLSVLSLSDEELARRADLEEETVKEVKAILREEFGKDA